MTGRKAVKEEAVEIAAVREVKRTKGREAETTEIAETEGRGEIAEKAEMTEGAGMKEIAEIAGENPGKVKMQEENQRVVAGQGIVVQVA